MQYRTIDSTNGTYRTEVNFRYAPSGLPIQTACTTLDYGTWKAETAAIAPGGTGLIVTPSHTGVFSDLYVHPDSANIADFGALPAGTEDYLKAVWITVGRLV